MKTNTIVLVVVLVALGDGVYSNTYEIIHLNSEGFGDGQFTAAYTRILGRGDMFWWFCPARADNSTSKPILLWLDGVTGVAPSYLANFGMFGPHDVNLHKRDNSWVNDYNLLFVDAPLGTGYSTIHDESHIPTLNDNIDQVLYTIHSLYDTHSEYNETDIYIFGQGDGSQLAIPAAIEIAKHARLSKNLKGIFIGNGVVAPALSLTKLGFYLEEMGYIDATGRDAVENYSSQINTLLERELNEEAFENFTSLNFFINEYAGAVAVNLGHIVEKLTNDTSQDAFGIREYLHNVYRNTNMYEFMQYAVAPILGIPEHVQYDAGRETAIEMFKDFYMKPITDKVEKILQSSNIKVIIYNGNLDAVSNTPGQLEWVNNLQWSGQADFLGKPRSTFAIGNLIEGYIREADKLQFYWINAAGLLVPLDNPVAIKRMIDRTTATTRS